MTRFIFKIMSLIFFFVGELRPDGVLRSSAQPRSNTYRHLSIGPGLYTASLCVLSLVARE